MKPLIAAITHLTAVAALILSVFRPVPVLLLVAAALVFVLGFIASWSRPPEPTAKQLARCEGCGLYQVRPCEPVQAPKPRATADDVR